MIRADHVTARVYAQTVCKALRAEYGHLKSMAHEISAVTGASNGAVKKWLAGENGPSGEHLIKLMACSDHVWDAVIALAGRESDGVEPRRRLRSAIAELKGRDAR